MKSPKRMIPMTRTGFFIKVFKIMLLLSTFSKTFALKSYSFLPDKKGQRIEKGFVPMSSQRFSGLQMWNELVELAQQAQEWPMKELAKHLGARAKEVREYLEDVSSADGAVTFFSRENKEWVKFDLNQMHFILPLNYEEWKALRVLFNHVESDSPLAEMKEKFIGVPPLELAHQEVYSQGEAVSALSLNSELIHCLQQCIEHQSARSEERRVGKECRSRLPAEHSHEQNDRMI